MGGKSGGAPTPPSAKEMAKASMGSNIGTAIAGTRMGMVNQTDPFGSIRYRQSGSMSYTDPYTGESYSVPSFTADSKLTGAAKVSTDRMLDATRSLAGNAGRVLGSPVNLEGFSGDAGLNDKWVNAGPIQMGLGDAGEIAKGYGPVDFSKDRQRVEDALMARMNPQLKQDRDSLRAELANQGIKLGSEAYDRGLDEANRTATDARMAAILGAGQEQTRLAGLARDQATFQNDAQAQKFGQLLAGGQFANDAQAQKFGQKTSNMDRINDVRQQDWQNQFASTDANNTNQLTGRSQIISELASMLANSQGYSPSYSIAQPQPIANTDIAGIMNQQYQNQYNAWNAGKSRSSSLFGNILGAAGKLGSAAIMASDKRLKTDIKKVGKRDGHNLYEYRYKGEPKGSKHRGYMAQEVAKKKPEAVVKLGKYLGLDYAKLPEVA